MLLGPQNSGKTTLLYSQLLQDKPFTATQTLGYNYEQVAGLAIWDIGGNAAVFIFS